MSQTASNVLVIGYGNPGRLDDGLGPAFASAVEALNLPGVTVDANYQLMVEDAAEIAQHDVVVFVDADVAGPEPFKFTRIKAKPALSFSSHRVEPEPLLALAQDLFGAKARAYVLAIRGYDFNGFGEYLSESARANLDAAVEFAERLLPERRFDDGVIESESLNVGL